MKRFFTKSGITLSVVLFFLALAIPALGQYTETTIEQGGLYSALAKDKDNNIYVTRVKSGTSGQTYEVVKYVNPLSNPTATPTVVYTGLTHSAQEFPWGLAVASNGDVYISTDFTDGSKNGEIIKVTAASNYTSSTSFLTGRYFTALTIDATDRLYAAEYNSGTSKYDIVRYITSGAPGTGTVVYSGLGGPGYSYITGLCIDQANNLYIAAPFSSSDHGKIIKVTAAGVASTISSNSYPSALAVDAQNNLYISEHSGTGTIYKLTKYTAAGVSSVLKTNLNQNGFYYPWGIAEVNSSLFVVDGDDGTNGGKVLLLKPIIAAPSKPVLAASSDTGISNSDNITNHRNPTFTGTAEAGSTVKLYEATTLIGSAVATGGNWSISAVLPLSGGTHKFTATATNSGNVTSALSEELSIQIDFTAPSLAISSDVAVLKAGEAATINFVFSEDPSSTFTWNGSTGDVMVTGGTLSAISGTGAIRFAAFTPAADTNSSTASITVAAGSYTDIAGNAGGAGSTPSLSYDTKVPASPSTPVLAAASDSGISNSDGITNTTTPTFTGTAEDGTTVTLYRGSSTVIGSATATGGIWSITSSTLTSGTYSITADARDAAGNISPASSSVTLTIDTQAPAAPSKPALAAGSDTGVSATDGITNITNPTFTGTAETGATVRLYDTDGTTLLGSGVATAGTWNITPASIATGSHTVTAKATDLAGNTGTTSTSFAINIDVTAPVVTGVTANATYVAPTSKTITFNEGSATLNGTAFTSGTSVTAINDYTLNVTDLAGNITSVNFSIIKTTPVITWANPADITYGTALTATQLNATANVPGTFTYTPASGTVLNAGASQNLKVDFVPTDAANYAATSKTVTINVGKATPVITWANPADITYGTALTATQLNATANVPGTFTYTPLSGTVLNAGANQNLKVDFVPTDAANYASTSKTVSINVGKATPIITWANPADITYGTALTATQLNATANVPGALTYTPVSGTVLNAGANQNLKVDFVPADAANYASTSKTVTINVGKATPIITWANPADIAYGTALTATQLNATADVTGTFTYTPASGTVLNAGASQNLKVDFVPTDAANYAATSKTVTINVGKTTPVITWASPADITYGTALTATQLNATANVPGTFTYTPASGTVLNAGANQNLKVDFVPADAANYAATSKTVTINVGKATPVITWANPADITYGTALTATQLNATADVTGTFTYTPASGTVLNAGANQNLKVDFVPADAANYASTIKTVTINVGKAAPVITWANPADISYGTALSATQLNATADVTGTFTYTPASGTVLNAGANQNLKVDFVPADAANYAATSKTVTINVGKATPVLTWTNPADITYGTALTATQLNATADVTGTFTYTPASGMVLNAGANQNLKVDFVPTDAANYAATSKTVTINVGKATPIITWANPADIAYGTALTATQLNATANVPGTFTYTPASGTVLNAGANQNLKVDFVPTDAANYASTSKTVTINVGKTTPVITWANPADISYGTALTATQLNATADVTGTFIYTPASGTVLNAGANQNLKVDFVPTDAANYAATSKTVTINVGKTTPVITWANPADITYGTALSATQLNATANVPGTFTYTPASGTVLNAGANQNLKVDFVPTDAANYASTSKTVSINIGKSTPVITWANPAGIAYGTALSATQLNATADVTGTFTYTPASGTVLNAGANQNLKVDFVPTDGANYAATSKTVTINVGKATPIITWANPADIIYGTALSATQLNATANIAGSFTYTPASGTVLNAGASQSLKVDFVPTDAANYAATSKTVTINVGKTTPIITWANPADIIYGTALSATQLNATANVPGTFTYTPASGTVLNAGANQNLKVDFVPTNTGDYLPVSKTVLINVAKKSINGSITVANKTYDGSSTAAITSSVLTGVLPTDQANVTLTSSSATFANANVGTAKVVTVSNPSLTGSSAGNYTLAGIGSVTADITAKSITITADARSKTYGDADPALTYSLPVSALVSGDVITGTLARAAGENAGSYLINQNNLSAGPNYIINFNGNNLLINKKGLVITLEDKSKAYLAPNPALTARYSGFVGSENSSVFTTPLSITTTATTNSPSGTYPITGSAAVAANYTISYVPGTLTILATPQTITFAALPNKLSTDPVFDLTATASSGLPVSYTSSNTNIARIVNGNQVEIRGAGTVTISANQAGNANYQAAAPVIQTLTIVDNPAPNIHIVSNKGNSVSKGETAILTASGASTYQWSNANGIISGQNTSTLTVRPDNNTTYTVTGFNQYGRSSTQSFTIEVRADFQALSIMNILTPNGDGKNDTWVVENIDMYPNNQVKVFDRSGKMVFETKVYNNTWDGTFKGAVLPEGSYYYIIDFGAGIGLRKGYITIIGQQ